jgi:hypothetical protein
MHSTRCCIRQTLEQRMRLARQPTEDCVARLRAAARPRTPTTTTGALRRLGACPTDDAARRAVERAVGTEEGALW